MFCNMEQNSLKRLFSLAYQHAEKKDGEVVKPGFSYFIMQTHLSGEFGTVIFQITAQIDCEDMRFFSGFIQTSGQSMSSLFSLRLHELNFFLSSILPLFNPEILIKDEVSFTSSVQSPDTE